MRAASSLASRLARPLVAAVILVWAISTALVTWYVDLQIQSNFDTELVESAHRQLYPALLEIEHQSRSRPTPAGQTLTMGEVPGDAYPDPLLLQLRAADGRVLLRSRGAPMAPFGAPLQQGFHDSIEHRIYTLPAPEHGLWLQIADPLAERAEASRQTLTGLVFVLLLMLPVLAWLIRAIAQRELRSLQQLQRELTERDSHNLQPLTLQALPLELQQLGQGINQLMGRLHTALDVERALAANAAHELRTPLASVRLRLHTAVEQAQINAADSLPLQEAQVALASLETLSHRTERLLQLSRAESGNTARFGQIDLLQLATTMAQEFWQQPRAQKRLDWLPPEADEAAPMPAANGPVLVHGDIDILAIALRNLIDNALTYSQGPVELAVQRHPPAVLVSDHGPGVPPEQLQRIQQRHVRADSQHMGYGLGMSIIRSICDTHGAQLVLISPVPGQSQGLRAAIVFQAAAAGQA